MSYIVPLLITLDVHSYPRTEREVPLWLEATLKLLEDFSIKATFFFPAILAEKFAGHVGAISAKGHEIGCHGLRHDSEEQYHLMPFRNQKDILCEAKERIERVVGREVVSFRSPAYKINGNTIRALEECGFKADSSVNPQRLGILSSDVTNVGWIYAPRKPYRPSFNNPFTTGKASLWEIPQAAFIFPFMANTGIAFGEKFMKLFFRTLYIESNLTRNAIVYMFHPEDIYPDRDTRHYKFKWRHLLPSRRMGFEVRQVLFHNKDPKKISQQNVGLLKMMKNTKNIRFITFKEALKLFERK